MRYLEYRHNNAYDSILLVTTNNRVIGAWTIGYNDCWRSDFEHHGDLDNWNVTHPDCTDPEAYGELWAESDGTTITTYDDRWMERS